MAEQGSQVLGSAVLELGVDGNKVRRGLEQTERETGRTFKLIKQAGTAAMIGVQLAAVGAAGASVKAAIDIQAQFAEVRTLMQGIGDDEFRGLQDGLLNLSKEFGIVTDDAIPALYQAISAGVPRENVLDFLEVASKASIGGITSVETAVDGITSVVNAYGSEVLSAGQAGDLMFTAVRLGKTTFEELSQSIFNVTPVAASLGVGFDQVAAGLATITAQGVPTSVATTQLRSLFKEASDSSSDLAKSILSLTGKSFADLIGEGQNVGQIMQVLRESMPDQEFRELFGRIEATNAALAITGPNADRFNTNLAEMGESAGAVDAAFKTMSETVKHRLGVMFNSIRVTAAEVALRALEKLFAVWDNNISPMLQGFAKWFTDNKNLVQDWWDGINEDSAPALQLVKNAVNGVKDRFTELGDEWKRIKVAWSTFNYQQDLATGIVGFVGWLREQYAPVDQVLTALESLVALVVPEGFGELVQPIVNQVNALSKWFEDNPTAIQDWLDTAWTAAEPLVTSLTDGIKGIYTEGLKFLWDQLRENWLILTGWFAIAWLVSTPIIKAIRLGLTTLRDKFVAITDWFDDNESPIQDWVSDAWTAAKIKLSSLKTAIDGIVTGGLLNLGTFFLDNPTIIQDWVNKAWEAGGLVIGRISGAIRTVRAAFVSVKTWIDANQENISTWFTTARERAGGVIATLTRIIRGVPSALTAISNWTTNTAETISTWFTTARTAAQPAISALTRIIRGVPSALTAISNWTRDTGETLSGWFTTARTAAQPVIESITRVIRGVPGALTALVNWTTDNAETLSGWFITAKTAAQPIISTVTRIIRGVVSALTALVNWPTNNAETLSAWWETLKEAVDNRITVVTTLIDGVKAALQGVLDWVAENPESLSTWWQAALNALQIVMLPIALLFWGVEFAFRAIADWIDKNPETISGWWQDVKDGTEDLLGGITAGLSWFNLQMDNLRDWFANNPEPISGWWQTVKDSAEPLVSGIYSGIEFVRGALAAVQAWAADNPETISGWWETLKNAVENRVTIVKTLFEGVLAVLQGILDWVRDNPETLSTWWEGAKAALELVMLPIAALFWGVETALTAIANWIRDNPETVSAWWEAVKVGTGDIIDVLTGSITGTAQSLIDLRDWLRDNKENISSWWQTASDAAKPIIEGIATAIEGIGDAYTTIKGLLFPSGEGEGLGALIKDKWASAITEAQTIFTGILKAANDCWTGIGAALFAFPGVLGTAVMQYWSSAIDEANIIFTTVAGWAQAAWDYIKGVLFPTGEGESLGSLITTHWKDPVVTAVQGVWDAAVEKVKGAINTMISLFNAPLKAWNNLSFSISGFGHTFRNPFTGGEVASIGWGGIHLSTPDVALMSPIPTLDTGGISIGPTVAALSQDGVPEMILPLNRAEEMGFGDGGQGTGLTLIVEGDMYGIESLEEHLGELLLRLQRRGVRVQQVAASG